MKLDFTKGIQNNTEPVQTPPGYYTDALNMRASGNAKKTQEGNTAIAGVPTNITQWGDCSIGKETIILGTVSGKSVIGSINEDDVWTELVPARAGVDVLGIVGPTQCEGKKNWAGENVIYFSTPKGARRINLTEALPTNDDDFDKVTSLFLEYDLPQVTYIGESNSGTLLTGSYQIVCRLVTESLASTPFGVASSIISVVKDSLIISRNDITGDPPQTSTTKSIDIKITNVDTAFKYVQLAILTYDGLSNIPTVDYSTLVAINNQSTIQYTYRGEADNFEVGTINELIASGVAYSTGQFLAQKDGSLLIGAPTEATQPDIDWFRVAKGIVPRYTIKKIPYKESLNFQGKYDRNNPYSIQETSEQPLDESYKNPVTVALYKGYRRNEVYSLTVTPIFIGGITGPTIHIPAIHTNNTPAVNDPDPDDGGVLGTFISEEKYPDNRYPTITPADGLRLHKMPTSKDQPIIEGNVETNNCFIRVLGIELTNIVLDPSELQYADQIAGFIVGRVDRRGQETQLCQGIVRPNSWVKFLNDQESARFPMMGDGYGDFFTDTKAGGTDTQQTNEEATPDLTDFDFCSPDITHRLFNPDQATHIRQVGYFVANPYAMDASFSYNSVRGRGDFNSNKAFFKNITGVGDPAWLADEAEVALSGTSLSIPAQGVITGGGSLGGKLYTTHILGGKVMKVGATNGINWMQTTGAPIQYRRDKRSYYRSLQTVGNKYQNDKMTYLHDNGGSFRCDFMTHQLVRRNSKQYGPLDQMVSMYTHYQAWNEMENDSTSFFNGDTFINKFGQTFRDEPWWPFTNTKDGEGSDGSIDQLGYLKAANMSGIVYYWLESDNNYDYKHFIPVETFSEDNVSEQGTVPYFPAYRRLMSDAVPFGLLTMHAEDWHLPGYPDQYNTQYSTQPTAKPYAVTPPEDIDRRAALVNRVIYSSQSVQGEKADGYQIFLPNDYYDIPQEFGELTDLYVNKELFASTAQIQWQLYFNTLATQATSAGQVVLGTGGAFNRPATPMSTVDGGYGGTSFWTHAVNTPFGRIFIDKLQGKVFSLGKTLAIVSQTWDDSYRLDIQKIDDSDIFVGSEPLRERVFLKLGTDMWDYNQERLSFISKHSFHPHWMFSHSAFLYSNNTNPSVGAKGIFKHSTGPTAVYYGVQYPSYITIVANMENTLSKQFKGLELLTKRTTEDGLIKPFHTFNQMEVWNDERYTGLIDIEPQTNTFQVPGVMEVLARKVKDSFRINLSRDIVINPELNIFALTNHAQRRTDTTLTKWLPKIKGNYIEIKLITDNSQGPLYFFDAVIELKENIR